MIIQKDSNFINAKIKNGYSDRSLANEIGVSNSTISRIEKNKPISPATAKKVCNALKVNFDDIFQIV